MYTYTFEAQSKLWLTSVITNFSNIRFNSQFVSLTVCSWEFDRTMKECKIYCDSKIRPIYVPKIKNFFHLIRRSGFQFLAPSSANCYHARHLTQNLCEWLVVDRHSVGTDVCQGSCCYRHSLPPSACYEINPPQCLKCFGTCVK